MGNRFWHSKAAWVWMLTLVAAVVVIARSSFTADMTAFLPQRPSKQQQLLVDQITVGSLSRMVLMGLEGGTPEQRAQASQRLAEKMRATQKFAIVANGATDAFARDREYIFNNRYLLSPAVTAEHFTETGLHQAIAQSVHTLASPAGMLLKQIFPRDPTGEVMALVGEMAQGERPSGEEVWTSKDGRRAMLMAQTTAAGSDTDAQELTLQAIRQAFGDIQQAQPELKNVQLLISGAPVFAVDARNTIRSEASRLSLTGALGVVLLLLLVYRSPMTVGVSLLPVLSAILMGIATVSLCYGVVHGVTVGFGTTLVGEAVDYSIYFFVMKNRQGAGAADAQRDWVARFWPTIRLGVMTSVCGFAALVFAGFPGLAQLGVYSIAGLMTAALVTRFVLPLIPARPPDARHAQRLGAFLTRQVLRLKSLQPAVVVLALASMAAIGWATWAHGTIWNKSLSGLNPAPQAAQQLDLSLRRDLGQPDLNYLVVVNAPDQEAALQKTEQVAAALQGLVDQQTIAGFETPTRYLPSQATQMRRRNALPPAAELEQRLQQALRDLPVTPATLQPFVHDVDTARQAPLLTPQSLQGTALALTLEAMLVQRPSAVTALLPLRALPDAQGQSGPISAAAVQQALQGHSDVLVLDIGTETHQLYTRYFNEAIYLSLAGLAAIVLLLGLTLRNAQRLLRVLLPLALTELVVIAGLVLCGQQLTLMHLIGLLLIVAVGSNYALFFDRHPLSDPTESATLASLLVANISTVLGFGVLGFSQVPVLNAIGRTVAPGAILALLFAAILVQHRAYPVAEKVA